MTWRSVDRLLSRLLHRGLAAPLPGGVVAGGRRSKQLLAALSPATSPGSGSGPARAEPAAQEPGTAGRSIAGPCSSLGTGRRAAGTPAARTPALGTPPRVPAAGTRTAPRRAWKGGEDFAITCTPDRESQVPALRHRGLPGPAGGPLLRRAPAHELYCAPAPASRILLDLTTGLGDATRRGQLSRHSGGDLRRRLQRVRAASSRQPERSRATGRERSVGARAGSSPPLSGGRDR